MADHITIGDISPRIQYAGDGAQVAFTYPFPIFADADIEVYEDATLKTITTHYTVAGAGNSAGGTVTFVTAPTSGVIVTLRRNIAVSRTTDFQESGEFRAKVINDELDKMTAQIQQVEDQTERSLRLSVTDAAGALELPDKATRASKYLGFDAAGEPTATDATGPTGPTGATGADGKYTAVGNGLEEETTSKIRVLADTGITVSATGVAVDVGTTASKIVQLDGAAKLPAVDGSQLTNLAGGASDTEKANIMLNAFRISVNGGLAIQNMVDGFVDEFEDETGVDTATSTNETYESTSDYYHNPAGPTQIAANVAIGSLIGAGGLAAAFDLTTVQDSASSATSGGASTSGYNNTAGQDWGSGVTKTVTQFSIYSSSDNLFRADGACGYKLQGSTDNFSASIVDLASGTTAGTTPEVITVLEASITTTTAYRYHRINFDGNGVNGIYLAEFAMFEAGAAPNMTLVSNSQTALAVPTDCFATLWQEDVDAVTLNTDLTLEASRDGGTTWTAITLAKGATVGTAQILTGSATISAQPSGTSMEYRIKTLNNKEQRLHGVALQWS